MTPMIDVTLLLLVFFLCMRRFKTLEGVLAADRPKDVGRGTTTAVPEEVVEVRIEVLQPGARVRPDGRPYTEADEAAGRRFEYDAASVVRDTVGARSTTDVAELERTMGSLVPDPRGPDAPRPRAKPDTRP
ncbi:MAG: biopolymer transporter ExbD [Planctomycetota bacterium]